MNSMFECLKKEKKKKNKDSECIASNTKSLNGYKI
jgi:hypothetical protein